MLLFLHALAFIFSVTPSFSLPVFSVSLFGHVPSCSAWPVLHVWWSCGALCLVSLLPIWTRGALLRRLGHRRCECEFDSVPAGVLHPNSHVRCLSARGIEERFVSQWSTWLLVGKAGWLASGTRGRLICHLRKFGPPLCGLPYRRPPAASSHGSYERTEEFRISLQKLYFYISRIQLAPHARRRGVPMTESEWMPVLCVNDKVAKSSDVPE